MKLGHAGSGRTLLTAMGLVAFLFCAAPVGATPVLVQQETRPEAQQPTLADRLPEPLEEVLEEFSEPLPLWQRTLYKTLTYQGLSNVSDFLFFESLIGGSVAATGAFVGVNAATAIALYYGFEYAWESYRPPVEEVSTQELAEKTVIYRSLNSTKNFVVSYAFSGNALVSGAFVAGTLVSDTAIFLTNELMWDTLRPRQAPSPQP